MVLNLRAPGSRVRLPQTWVAVTCPSQGKAGIAERIRQAGGHQGVAVSPSSKLEGFLTALCFPPPRGNGLLPSEDMWEEQSQCADSRPHGTALVAVGTCGVCRAPQPEAGLSSCLAPNWHLTTRTVPFRPVGSASWDVL